MSNRIIKRSILEDEVGRFIPVCEFYKHPGVIKHGQYKVCERRGCSHYVKYRAKTEQEERPRMVSTG